MEGSVSDLHPVQDPTRPSRPWHDRKARRAVVLPGDWDPSSYLHPMCRAHDSPSQQIDPLHEQQRKPRKRAPVCSLNTVRRRLTYAGGCLCNNRVYGNEVRMTGVVPVIHATELECKAAGRERELLPSSRSWCIPIDDEWELFGEAPRNQHRGPEDECAGWGGLEAEVGTCIAWEELWAEPLRPRKRMRGALAVDGMTAWCRRRGEMRTAEEIER